jgi:hypothetical protein
MSGPILKFVHDPARFRDLEVASLFEYVVLVPGGGGGRGRG